MEVLLILFDHFCELIFLLKIIILQLRREDPKILIRPSIGAELDLVGATV